jgi:hypothetical protein
MTYAELEDKIQEIIPGASLEFDRNGQIVIYTGLEISLLNGEDLVEHNPEPLTEEEEC